MNVFEICQQERYLFFFWYTFQQRKKMIKNVKTIINPIIVSSVIVSAASGTKSQNLSN